MNKTVRRKGKGKRGPARREPSPDQKARLSELRERAHQISLLGAENEWLLGAAASIRTALVMVHKGVAARQQRRVSPDRPAKQVADEVTSLQRLEEQGVAWRRKQVEPDNVDKARRLDDSMAELALYPEPVNQRVRAALCLLRFADEMLRAEVGLAGTCEEVPLPGETERQILDRLVKTELGLSGVAAARLTGRPERFEDADRRSAERREKAVNRVFDPLKNYFVEGLRRSRAQLGPRDMDKVDQLVRQVAVQASAEPGLDQQLPRVNARGTSSRKPRLKAPPAQE